MGCFKLVRSETFAYRSGLLPLLVLEGRLVGSLLVHGGGLLL